MTDPHATIADLPRVSFRPLQDDDPTRMTVWLRDPDVAPWYGDGEPTLALVQARYATRIAGTDTTHGYIMEIDGEPVGYIQAYRLEDEPRYAVQLRLPTPIDRDAVATDLFIGEAAFRNRGWGGIILRAFLAEIVFGSMHARVAIIAPEPGNRRAIRTYEQVGFRWLHTVHIIDDIHPENSGDEYVMLLAARTFFAM